jgi:hypothetical protein
MAKNNTNRKVAGKKGQRKPHSTRKLVTLPPPYERTFKDYAEELAAFKVDNSDLDAIAVYFGLVFEYRTEPMIVLVSLLRRLSDLAKRKNGMVSVEDTVNSLCQRLFLRCGAGEDAADKFADASTPDADKVLAKVA